MFDFPIIASRNPWPEAPFGAALIDGFDTALALKFDRLDIEGGLVAGGVSLMLNSNASGTGAPASRTSAFRSCAASCV